MILGVPKALISTDLIIKLWIGALKPLNAPLPSLFRAQ